jgi:hypothetical protein
VKTFSLKNEQGFSMLLILVAAVIACLVVILLFLYQSQAAAPKNNVAFPKVSQSATPNINLQQNLATGSGKLYLYQASGGNLTQITTFDNFSTNNIVPVDTPIIGNNLSIYFHDANKVYSYKFDTKAKSEIMTADTGYSFDKINFQDADWLYVTELPNDHFATINPPFVFEKNVSTGAFRRIALSNSTLVGSLDYLFKDTKGEDVIGTFSKQSCGKEVKDSGKIFLIHFGDIKNVASIGGCDKKAQYVGSFAKKNRIIFLSYLMPSPPPNGVPTPNPAQVDLGYEQFYSQDLNNQMFPLLKLDDKNRRITSFVYNPDQNKVAIFYLDGMYVLDADSGQLSKKLPLNQNTNSFYEWRGDYGVGYFADQRKMWLAKMPEAKVIEFPLPSQFSASAQPQIIGNWQGQALVSIFQPD